MKILYKSLEHPRILVHKGALKLVTMPTRGDLIIYQLDKIKQCNNRATNVFLACGFYEGLEWAEALEHVVGANSTHRLECVQVDAMSG